MPSRAERLVGVVMLLDLFLTTTTVQAINEFILELGLKENSSEKRQKMASLALNTNEWTRVCLFCNILKVSITMSLNCTDAWLYSACKQRPASVLFFLKSESPKCPPSIGADVCSLEESLKQTSLCVLGSGT